MKKSSLQFLKMSKKNCKFVCPRTIFIANGFYYIKSKYKLKGCKFLRNVSKNLIFILGVSLFMNIGSVYNGLIGELFNFLTHLK